MKEAITKFDLEAAFKALDDIEIPKAGKVRANRPALNEIFSRKSKFDALMEEYYDISSNAELEDAQEAREAEVAKAKLERIEKIVDLDADSPEDLLTSYVGKHIIQCPQCMTLFYKNPEDVVESENDSSVVNVNEVCQHCGNDSGYTLIGKVGEAEPDAAEEPVDAEIPTEDIPEEPAEEPAEYNSAEELDLEDIDLDLDFEDEEVTEESFNAHGGEALVEEFADDPELDDKLDANNEYIEYLRAAIANEEAKLDKEDNEQIKTAIQKTIDSLNADLDAALPDAVKDGTAIASDDVNVEDATTEDIAVDDVAIEDADVQEESCDAPEGEQLTEGLHEEADLEVSDDEFETLINSSEFSKPISSVEVRAMFDDEKNENVEECANSEDSSEDLTEAIMPRSTKCDWVLKNYTADNGNKFKKYLVVVCSNERKTTGKNKEASSIINKALENPVVTFKNKELGVLANKSSSQTKYKDVDNIAKGLSMKRDIGPVLVFLSENDSIKNASFLCQYFNGAVDTNTDKLNDFIRDIKGDKKANKSASAETEKRVASKIERGDKIKLDDDSVISVNEVEESKLVSGGRCITTEDKNGNREIIHVQADHTFNIMLARPEIEFESFNSIMSNLDELNESALEEAIANSLVESYGNVAGFRLSECNYANNKLAVDGTIYFTSGKTRKTTYTFNESYVAKDGKVSMVCLNEKLGLDKQFTLTGRIENKTLITESFKRSK